VHDHAHLEQQFQHQQYDTLESMSQYHHHTSQGYVPTAQPRQDDLQHWQTQQADLVSRSAPKHGGLWFLLSQDIESFIVQHREEYDALTQKWSQCTIEEWYAGEKGEPRTIFIALFPLIAAEHLSDLTEFMEIVRSHLMGSLCSLYILIMERSKTTWCESSVIFRRNPCSH
jgi:hypothetical protein